MSITSWCLENRCHQISGAHPLQLVRLQATGFRLQELVTDHRSRDQSLDPDRAALERAGRCW